MPLETGTYISDLNASNPAHTDGLNNADAHIRLIKSVIQATFPNITGPTDCTQAQLTSMAANLAFPGEIKLWATNTAPTGWLTCDGSAVSRTTYAALFTILGTGWGAGDGSTTFNLPDFRDRYPRGKGTYTVGQTLTSAVQTHAHTASVTSGSITLSSLTLNSTGDHNHNVVIDDWTYTGTSDPGNHTHSYVGIKNFYSSNTFVQTTATAWNAYSSDPTGGGGAHTHTINGTAAGHTTTSPGNHSHSMTAATVTHNLGLTVADTLGSETRPASAVVLFIIKT